MTDDLIKRDADRLRVFEKWLYTMDLAGMSEEQPNLADIADTLEAQAAEIARLRKALGRMVYETTHLSPMKPNGDHDCTIKADALAQARAALEGKP